MKIVANYLPQFHVIPQNSEWWGPEYTDWIGVQNAKPLYAGHYQPRVPLDKKYRHLDDAREIRWQADLARRYGVEAFAIYHYWFSSDLQLLQTPSEILLSNRDINIDFLFLWDNTSWARTWSNVRKSNNWAPSFDEVAATQANSKIRSDGVLAELKYGTKQDWRIHFEYLLPFFEDPRYVKLEGMPVFGFMEPRNDSKTIHQMTQYWDVLAKQHGFPGVYSMTSDSFSSRLSNANLPRKFRYSPFVPQSTHNWVNYKASSIRSQLQNKPIVLQYDREWRSILHAAVTSDSTTFLSGFVSFDDTPRRGERARIIAGSTPEKFERYLSELIAISRAQHKELLFLSAWNEWGEGMYLEPDEVFGYAWLEAIHNALDSSAGGKDCEEF